MMFAKWFGSRTPRPLRRSLRSNPLEATAAGQVLGAVSFYIGLNLTLTGSQFGGQFQGHGQGHG